MAPASAMTKASCREALATSSLRAMRPASLACGLAATVCALLFSFSLLPSVVELLPPDLFKLSPVGPCRGTVIYNKPFKTGSKSIRTDVIAWAERTNRTVYWCSTYRGFASRIPFYDCIPQKPDPCGILTSHNVISPSTYPFLKKRLPGAVITTSTREPARRILSHFLMKAKLTGPNFNNSLLEKHLQTFYSPWFMYNFHFNRTVSRFAPVPPELPDEVRQLVKQYDVVIDITMRMLGNVQLEHYGLFRLSGTHKNNRNGVGLEMTAALEKRLTEVSAVEKVIDDALMQRMATVYNSITGEPRCVGVADEQIRGCMRDVERELFCAQQKQIAETGTGVLPDTCDEPVGTDGEGPGTAIDAL